MHGSTRDCKRPFLFFIHDTVAESIISPAWHPHSPHLPCDPNLVGPVIEQRSPGPLTPARRPPTVKTPITGRPQGWCCPQPNYLARPYNPVNLPGSYWNSQLIRQSGFPPEVVAGESSQTERPLLPSREGTRRTLRAWFTERTQVNINSRQRGSRGWGWGLGLVCRWGLAVGWVGVNMKTMILFVQGHRGQLWVIVLGFCQVGVILIDNTVLIPCLMGCDMQRSSPK